jgi:hypothetical protein
VTTSPTTSTATSTGTSTGTNPASRPTQLPHLTGPIFISDGGLETTLVFHEGLELPDFAAFPLLDTAEGRGLLERYFEPYFAVADRDGFGMLVDTPTWRANADWGPRLGYDRNELAAVNERAVEVVRGLAARWPGVTVTRCADEGDRLAARKLRIDIDERGGGPVAGTRAGQDVLPTAADSALAE